MRSIRTLLSTVVEENVREMWIPAGVPVKIPRFGGSLLGSQSSLEETVTFCPAMTAEEARDMVEFQQKFNELCHDRQRQQAVNLEPCLLFVTHDHTVINFGNPNEGTEVYIPEAVLDHRHDLKVSGVDELVHNAENGMWEPFHPRLVWNPDEQTVYVIGGVGGPKTSPAKHYHSSVERIDMGKLDSGSRLTCFPRDLRWTDLSICFESKEGNLQGGALTHFGTFAACMFQKHLVVLGGFRKQKSISSTSVKRRRSDQVSAFKPGGQFVWRSLAPLPMALSSSAAVPFQGSLFSVGGVDDTGCAVRRVFKLNGIQCGTWECVPYLRHPRKLAAVFSDSRYLFVFGGCDGSHEEWLCSAEKYDPELNIWTSLPSMPQPLMFPYAFEVFGEVFVVGKNASVPVFKFCRRTEKWEDGPVSFFDCATPPEAMARNEDIMIRGQFVLVGQQPTQSFGFGESVF
jgi:hypothetical protein